MISLFPGETKEGLKTAYYGKKAAICLAVLFVGTLFGAAAKFSAMDKAVLGEDGAVARGNYREEPQKIKIQTDYGQQQMDFQVEVEPKLLAEEETERLFDLFLERLPEYILG